MNLSGNDIGAPEFDTFCSFNGFMVQTFVIQTDYWVLVVAACTYFILADHRQLSSWAQDHRVVLTCLPWAFSLLWAVVGLIVAGYGTIGPCKLHRNTAHPSWLVLIDSWLNRVLVYLR